MTIPGLFAFYLVRGFRQMGAFDGEAACFRFSDLEKT